MGPEYANNTPFNLGSMAIGGVLFDIDGVLVTSWKPIDGAGETLATLADHQIARSYLTNTTTRTRVQIADLLTEAGMAVAPDEVVTAAVLTADFVRDRYPDARCFLVNSGDIADDMPGIDVVASVDTRGGPMPDKPGRRPARRRRTGVRPRDAELGLRLDGPGRARRGDAPQHLVDHRRRTAHRHRASTSGHGRGVRPQGHRRRQARARRVPGLGGRLGVEPDEMYMVGDDLNNDVLAGQVVGMTGVLVRTGKFRQDTLDRWAADEFAMQPNHVIDSVADLPALLGL